MVRRYDEVSQGSRGPTRLEQQLAGGESDKANVTPVDAFNLARRKFLKKQRIDMVELAAELGVGRATLYRWVGSRDQLLGEVLWSLTDEGIQQAKQRAKGKGVDWVMSIFEGWGYGIPTFEPLRHFVSTEPETALRVMTTKASPHQARVIQTFADILEEAVATKGLKLRLDPQKLAFVMIRIGESFLWSDLITGEEPDLDTSTEVVRVLLSA